MIELAVIDSPVGALTIASHDERVCVVWFGSEHEGRSLVSRWYPKEPVASAPDPGGAVAALSSYFAGDLNALDGVQVELRGTEFQQRVWQQLRNVRAGTTASYQDIARAIGAGSAVRAVGAANGANPVPIIVPCHRIIGSNGSLTGYGGGLDRKRWLLAHEGQRLKFEVGLNPRP
jgi:methylated-DNA-[protein]-cysteine S-methyltransferase